MNFKLSRKRRRLGLGILIIVLILVPVWLSQRGFQLRQGPAKLYFSSPYTEVLPNQVFTVDLRVDTNFQAINAVQAHLQLDPKKLTIVNMTTNKSFCTLYTENSFDPSKGTVNIACGAPHPGFQGDSLVVSLSVRAKAAGSATIKADPQSAQVLADDGKGTNLLGSQSAYSVYIKQATY